MATRGWLWALTAVGSLAAAGCTSLSSWANAASHTVHWKKNGFTVADIRRNFTYNADRPEEVAELDGRLTLTDLGADGTVDRVKGEADDQTWVRGEPGSEAVFADADQKFRDVRDYLRIDGYRAEWEQMSEADRAQAAGLYRRR